MSRVPSPSDPQLSKFYNKLTIVCPSGCDGVEDDFLHANNIHRFENCTVINGNIQILIPTFYGYVPMVHSAYRYVCNGLHQSGPKCHICLLLFGVEYNLKTCHLVEIVKMNFLESTTCFLDHFMFT